MLSVAETQPVNAPNAPYRPTLTDAARPSTFTVRAIDEDGEARDTPIAGEHPLTLYVDKREILTLMTLGAAPEALAIGYLRNQRLLGSLDEIVSVQVDWDVNAVVVNTRHGLKDLDAKLGKRTTTSGCGQGTVFGDLMEEIDAVKLHTDAALTRATLYALLDRVRGHDTIYKQSGAVHGCALASNEDGTSEILYFVEDVGRHNAVDAIAAQTRTLDVYIGLTTENDTGANVDENEALDQRCRIIADDRVRFTVGRHIGARESCQCVGQWPIVFECSGRAELRCEGYRSAGVIGLDA